MELFQRNFRAPFPLSPGHHGGIKSLMKMQEVEEKNEGNAKESIKSRVLARLRLSEEIKMGWELEKVPQHWLHKKSRTVNQFARWN